MQGKSFSQRICVMGGSFNPPTLAHLRLMQASLDELHADIGLFVPSRQEYVAKKMMETGDMPIIEGNTWKDTFWGIDIHTGQGENNLGRILMEVRKELLSQRPCSGPD